MSDEKKTPAPLDGNPFVDEYKSVGAGISRTIAETMFKFGQSARERLAKYQRDLSGEPVEEATAEPQQQPEQEQGDGGPSHDALEGLRRVTSGDLAERQQAAPQRAPTNARARRAEEIARRNMRERVADIRERQQIQKDIFRPTRVSVAVRGVLQKWRREAVLARQHAERREPTAGTQPAAARMADAARSHEDERAATPATQV